jgi:hypothetical protein
MSGHWIIIIPEEAGFVPVKARRDQAFFLARDMSFDFLEVSCPVCGDPIDDDWWGGADG